jgi:large subunit ribosomal protein L9
MKVILLKDVANLGRKFDIVTVSDGYALNQLMPKNAAQIASPENVRRLTIARDKKQAEKGMRADEFKTALASLGGKIVVIKTKVTDQGHLFEALKPSQVVEALKDHGVNLNEATLKIIESVKSAGKQNITLIFGEVKETLTINIISK